MLSKLIIAGLLFAQFTWAQAPEEHAKQAVPGYVDPSDSEEAAKVSVVYTKPNCGAFLDSKGNIGEYGKQVIRSIEQLPNAYFNFVPSDFTSKRKLCPNFINMSLSQKRLFWVWMLRSLGHTESSCRAAPPVTIKTADLKNEKPGYHADRGMFQLNHNRCGEIDLNDPLNSIDCTVKVLAKEILTRGKLTASQTKTEKLNDRTYWGPLRTDSSNSERSKGSIRNSKRTQETISRFKFCQAQPDKQDEEREEDKDSNEMTVEITEAKTKVIYAPKEKDGKVVPGKAAVVKAKTDIASKAKSKKKK